MKHIALFCDGTWQKFDQRYPTNVAKLSRTLTPSAPDGAPQVVYYDDGVGVGDGGWDVGAHLLGGAMGEGLDYKIARAYEFLCLNYEPGDHIYIFGFSRGAYTARSLAGLLRWGWILKREYASNVFEVTALYRTRPRVGAPGAEEQAFQDRMAAYRATHCHPANIFTDTQPYVAGDPSSLTPKDDGCAWLQYVGVWDTVGSLGIPKTLPLATQIDARYQFYDTNLSRFVRSARHAVSIDERRETFSPTLWDNIADMNTNAQAARLAYADRPYQQRWFPGGHGSVGGGGDDGGLSLVPMLWVAEGAARAGLGFDRSELDEYARIAHPDAKFQKDSFSIGGAIMEAVGTEDRAGPDEFDEVSLSARIRWARVGDYRPGPLRRAQGLEASMNGFQPPPDPQTYYDP